LRDPGVVLETLGLLLDFDGGPLRVSEGHHSSVLSQTAEEAIVRIRVVVETC